jgi:serine/threonine protein kinase
VAETLGQYKIVDHLGITAVAEIYRAIDTALGRTVALRVLRDEVASDPPRRDALLAAARLVQPLSHPNIAELFDVGEENGRPFLVFEHTPGDTLRATIAGCPLNVRRAVDLGAQLADALAEAHGRGIVHRALKPDLVVITAKGRPKILDFCLAATPGVIPRSPDGVAGGPAQGPQTVSPEDVECLSPEQVLGDRGDERTDVFALGCILFEMLTGTQPFSAATAADTSVAVLGRTPPPPSQLNARVPGDLDRLVARCLAKSLDGRCENAAAVAAELRRISTEMETDDGAGRATSPIVRSLRDPSRLPLALLILACLVGVAGVALWLLWSWWTAAGGR